jgi:hypothetical protein
MTGEETGGCTSHTQPHFSTRKGGSMISLQTWM